jgi:hypothetical protein
MANRVFGAGARFLTAALGLWLTRGGWHGHHHFALESTNAGADSLIAAVGREWCGILAGSGTATWQIRLRIGR